MIGFEVKINEQIIEAALELGVVSVVLNRLKKEDADYVSIDISGLNTETADHLKWIAQDLKVGDSINVLVKDVVQPSLWEIKKAQPEEIQNERKVKLFYSLQKELTEKGLI